MDNLLKNGNFDQPGDSHHRCAIYRERDGWFYWNVPNIFVPPGWDAVYFIDDPKPKGQENEGYNQPEARLTGLPERVLKGGHAFELFTFHKRHWAGLIQSDVNVTPGATLRATAYAHAWSNHGVEGHEGCEDDPACSVGAGRDVVYIPAGEAPTSGDPWLDGLGNFTFRVGIDPTGDDDPLADTVVWGEGAHVYNGYFQLPYVEAVAQGFTVTVFVESHTLWSFKHNNAYIDSVALVEVTPEPEPEPETPRGAPREQYVRNYVLMPPGADREWWAAAAYATGSNQKFTIGGSADDGGIGDLDRRRVIAVNPNWWGEDLRVFFDRYYPGVMYQAILAHDPGELGEILQSLDWEW